MSRFTANSARAAFLRYHLLVVINWNDELRLKFCSMLETTRILMSKTLFSEIKNKKLNLISYKTHEVRIDNSVHNSEYQMQDNCVCRQTHTYPHHTQLNLNIASADISGSPLNQSHGNILLLLPSCRRARVCRVDDPATTCLLIDNYLTRLWVNNMPR